MGQQYTVYIVHYKERPDSVQWDKECSSAKEARDFAQDIEDEGGIAIIIEDVRTDSTVIGTDREVKNVIDTENGETE